MKSRNLTTFWQPAVTLLLATVLLLAAPIAARADGGVDEITQTVDGYQVTLVFEKPIASGENQVHLRINDAQGLPVTHAQVEVTLVAGEAEHAVAEAGHTEVDTATSQSDMHDMEAMPENEPDHAASEPAHAADEPVHASDEPAHASDGHAEMGLTAFSAGHEAGEYGGEISVSGPGDWTFLVHLAVEDHELEFSFPLHVAGTQAGRNVLLSYLFINAVIVGVAAFFKFKPAAA